MEARDTRQGLVTALLSLKLCQGGCDGRGEGNHQINGRQRGKVGWPSLFYEPALILHTATQKGDRGDMAQKKIFPPRALLVLHRKKMISQVPT